MEPEKEKTDNKEIVDEKLKESSESQEKEEFEETDAKEQDRFLPIANITRIMRRGLPKNAKISKDAKETIQECVSEFISFVTSE